MAKSVDDRGRGARRARRDEGAALVQQWVTTPASNYGLIVYNDTNTDDLYITSSEGAVLSERPQLTVSYSLP